MALGDGDPLFDSWQREDDPSSGQVEFMAAWLNGLDDMPRREPSRLTQREHPHTQDELRLAYLIEADAFVVYALDSRDAPRLLYVGKEPPEGLTFGP